MALHSIVIPYLFVGVPAFSICIIILSLPPPPPPSPFYCITILQLVVDGRLQCFPCKTPLFLAHR